VAEDKDAFSVIGHNLPKVDAHAKVSGQTLFADDLVLPRMLFARLLRSPHPHARIRSIDASRAAAHPGVAATLVGSELPIPFGILPVSQDEHALCIDRVRFVGDPVAAVAAVDEDVAFEFGIDQVPDDVALRRRQRLEQRRDFGRVHRVHQPVHLAHRALVERARERLESAHPAGGLQLGVHGTRTVRASGDGGERFGAS
jgi:xanthine dehydrogenase molybdopterin-binding subunit B